MMPPVLRAVLVTAALAGAGCRCGDPPARCLDAAAHAARLAHVAIGALAAAPAQVGELGRVITERCTRDAWPAAVITCVRGAGSERALRGCRERLTLAQREALDRAVRPALGMAP